MRYLIVSDIHSNWEALSAVLRDAAGEYGAILNCGDIVGYGPDPNVVAEWCREHTPHVVRGNHDKVCATLENLEWFNPVAATSAEWTHRVLSRENLDYLMSLPAGPVFVDGVEMVHGSPADEDDYLLQNSEICDAARHLDRQLAFFGHTHVQACYLVTHRAAKRLHHTPIDLKPDCTYMVNPGSVGQPRDRNARAAWALYDSERRVLDLRRSEYDVRVTQDKILRHGLPDSLAARLMLGR